MVYIVAKYYIGFQSRYDGTGNTDKAEIHLFNEKPVAIQFIVDDIQKDIEELKVDGSY